MSAQRLQDVFGGRDPVGSGEADSCELMGELSSLMVGVAAALARAQRHLRATDPIRAELCQVDEAFAAPISLARKLAVLVHATHDCSRSSRSTRG
jgi:hypothetical protein